MKQVQSPADLFTAVGFAMMAHEQARFNPPAPAVGDVCPTCRSGRVCKVLDPALGFFLECSNAAPVDGGCAYVRKADAA